MKYRWRLGEHVGTWQPTKAAAILDAIAAGYARHDEQYGAVMKDEMLVVEEERDA